MRQDPSLFAMQGPKTLGSLGWGMPTYLGAQHLRRYDQDPLDCSPPALKNQPSEAANQVTEEKRNIFWEHQVNLTALREGFGLLTAPSVSSGSELHPDRSHVHPGLELNSKTLRPKEESRKGPARPDHPQVS